MRSASSDSSFTPLPPGNENVCVIDGYAGNDLRLDIQHLVARLLVDRDVLRDDLALAALVRLQGREDLRTNGHHLRPALEDDDVRKDAAAVCGRGLIKHVIFIVAEVDGVGGEAGLEGDHHARCKIAAEAGRRIHDDRGLVLLRKLGERLLIGPCAVGCKVFVLCDDDLIGTAGDETGCQMRDLAAEKDGGDRFTVMRLELLRLCEQLIGHRIERSVLLFGKYPYAFVIFLSHLPNLLRPRCSV